MEVNESVQEFLELKEQEKEIKNKLSKLRGVILKQIEEQQGLPIIAGDKQIAVRNRQYYDYDPKLLREAVGTLADSIISEKVDVSKLNKLVKAGFISEDVVGGVRTVNKVVETIVIEEVKNESS